MTTNTIASLTHRVAAQTVLALVLFITLSAIFVAPRTLSAQHAQAVPAPPMMQPTPTVPVNATEPTAATPSASKPELPSSTCTRLPAATSSEYSLGCPRIWTYQRVYPFLDGIFQDVANTQLQPLTLAANSANAANLDATQTSVQVGASFSATAGLQNQLAQQQNAVISANSALQAQLLSQQAQLTQQLLQAQQTLGQDTNTLNQLSASATQDQKTAAQQAVATDTNNISTLNSQLTLVKAQLPTTITSTPASFSAPNPSSTTFSATTPLSASSITAPPGSVTPSFPASKMMDNQVGLLWERLSRLVATLAQADSLSNYDLVLASFNVDLLPLHRKNQEFAAAYKVTGTGGESCSTEGAMVIDTFPNASATNILSTRYNDTRFGISGLLSFFSFGISAQITRERLQLSQSLGQSAYISGFGIGTNTFGWAFGRNLGDDSISPGNRTVFAIIAIPSSCNSLAIAPVKAGWFKDQSNTWETGRDSAHFPTTPTGNNAFNFAACMEYTSDDSASTTPLNCKLKRTKITQITYSAVEFDPNAPASTPASIQLTLDQAIDPQLTVSVNGRVLQRARDSFGRAISGSGAGGLLETSSFIVNTWVPNSSRQLSLLLDPSQVERRFPDIVISSPLRYSYLGEALTQKNLANGGTATVQVSGSRFYCEDPCVPSMPPLSVRRSSAKQVIAFHRHNPDELILSVPTDTPIAQQSAATSAANVQVLTNQAASPWGSKVSAVAEFPGMKAGEPELYSLNCHPAGARLICKYPKLQGISIDLPHTVQFHDPDHAVGPIFGWSTSDDATDHHFIVWNLQQPRWIAQPAGAVPNTLLFCVALINDDKLTTLQLFDSASSTPIASLSKSGTDCTPDSSGANVWKALISLADFDKISDQMTLVGNDSEHKAVLLNLRSTASPTVSFASDDFHRFTGINLVFPFLSIDGKKFLQLSCDKTGASCILPTSSDSDLGTTAATILLASTSVSPVTVTALKNTAGSIAPWQFTPPPAKSNTPAQQRTANGQSSITFSISGSSTSASTPTTPNSPSTPTPPNPAPLVATQPATTPAGASTPPASTAAPPVVPAQPKPLTLIQ